MPLGIIDKSCDLIVIVFAKINGLCGKFPKSKPSIHPITVRIAKAIKICTARCRTIFLERGILLFEIRLCVMDSAGTLDQLHPSRLRFW
jgi:hypothetical protein